jgi:PAS domain S-box-containing protein
MEARSQLADRILDQVADAVINGNRSGEIIRWNLAALFGYSAEEALGQIAQFRWKKTRRPPLVVFLNLRLLIQHRVEQREVNFNVSIVADEAQFAKLVHEMTNAGSSGADHLC